MIRLRVEAEEEDEGGVTGRCRGVATSSVSPRILFEI